MGQARSPAEAAQDPLLATEDIAAHVTAAQDAAAPVTVGHTADGHLHRTAKAATPVLQQTLAGYAAHQPCQIS